jgi:hypothetical protein
MEKKQGESGCHRERSGCAMRLFCIVLQERERAHPNMVHVHDSLQESSSIYLFEVGIDGRHWSQPFFSRIALQNFLLVCLELGEKKNQTEKKVNAQAERKGPDHPNHLPLLLTRSTTDVFRINF